jgi:Ca2+-binding EF-hand superfamily protein
MNDATIARPISSEAHAELREDFDEFDIDGDGRLEFDEFLEFMDGLGADMSNEECRIGFAEIDTDRDGVIEFDEFVAWWRSD